MKQGETDRPAEEVELDLGCKAVSGDYISALLVVDGLHFQPLTSLGFVLNFLQGWRRHGSYCYFIGTETKTFDEAKDHCKNSESYLADVSNGYKNVFL